jgi:hypothetical protein
MPPVFSPCLSPLLPPACRPADRYSPFLNLEGDAADIGSYGYTYSGGRAIGDSSRRSGGRRGDARLASVNDVTFPVDASVTRVGSAAGKEAVRTAIQQWTGNYTGYTWSVRFQELDQHQMQEPVHLLVYLKSQNHTIMAIPAQVDELNELRNKPNYCGSIAGFNEQVHVHSEAPDGKIISRAVDLTQCLKEAGISPNVPAINPEDFSRGPAKVPVRLSDLKIHAVTADGRDVTEQYNSGKVVISWSVPVTKTTAQVRAMNGGDPIEAVAFAHPSAFGLEQEVLSMTVGDVDTA